MIRLLQVVHHLFQIGGDGLLVLVVEQQSLGAGFDLDQVLATRPVAGLELQVARDYPVAAPLDPSPARNPRMAVLLREGRRYAPHTRSSAWRISYSVA